jgi:PAS domain S-box-containing protein
MTLHSLSDAMDSIRRVRRIVLLSLLFTFLAIVMVRALSLRSHYEDALQTGRQRAQNLASLVADHFLRTIDTVDGALIHISQAASASADNKANLQLNGVLEQSLLSLRGVGSLSIVNEQGRITHSTFHQIVGENRGDRPIFQRLQKDLEIEVAADTPVVGRLTGGVLIPLGRRITLLDGSFKGVAIATLELERLSDFYRTLEIGEGGVISILRPDGQLLFRYPQANLSLLPSEHPLVELPAVHTANAVHVGQLEAGGPVYLTAIRQVRVPAARVAISISRDALLAPWWLEVWRSLIIIFVTGGALALAAYQISRQVRERLIATEDYLIKNRQFRDILDHAPVTITVKDREGKITLANREFQRRVNRNAETIVGAQLHELLSPEYADQLSAMDHAVFEHKAVIQRELISPEPRTYLSTKFPLFNAKGEVVEVGSISLDITDTKASKTINLRIFEKSLDVILVTDSKGTLIRVSPSVFAILGYKPEEVEGRSAGEFIHVDDLEATREEMRLARRGLVTRNFESRYIHKNGQIVRLNWTGMWVAEENQHFFIGHDMTERTKLEQELRQSQKMEAIGQLTGGLAHDYNNLLTVILGNAELLTESLNDQPALLPLAQATVDAADRSAVLTQRLLAFGRRQALDAKATDLNQLVAGMMDLVRITVGEQINIDLALGEEPWVVKIDRSQLETAILNLVANARDAMQNVGTIRIETGKASFDEEAASISPELKIGNFMMLAVSDNGGGMSPETLSRVFEPFFTTKETGKGTGLGLSMVYGFVKQSGGHISIYSEPGIGTSVKLYFPPVDREAAQHLNAANAQDALLTGAESILLVEDEPMVRVNTERQLVLLGYNVKTAASGNEALQLCEAGFRPDLLLTDVIMAGGMNGRVLAERLTQALPGLRVLFMSGYTSGVLANAGNGIPEGTHFLGKPFRRGQLAKAVREALDEKQALISA